MTRAEVAAMNHLRSLLCGALGAMALTFAAQTAFADALPPDTEECDPQAHPGNVIDTSKIGASCTIPGGGQGTCHCSVCTALSYADAGPDAHGPTGSVAFNCLECKPGKQVNCSSCPEPDAGSSDTCVDTDGGASDDGGLVGDDAGHALGGNDPAGSGSSGSSGGCSIGGGASAAAPWLLAAVVPVIFRRRRRASK